MSKKQSTDKIYKITTTVNVDKQEVKVKFTPKLTKETANTSLLQMHFNTLLSGFHIGMSSILIGFPELRPATQEEVDLNTYVFQGNDNDLFKARKKLYYSIAEAFNTILSDAFPDVEYIETAQLRQQEFVTEKSTEEVEQYHQQVKDLVEKLKGGK